MDTAMLFRHTLGLVDHDLDLLEFVHNVDEDEVFTDDALRSDPPGQGDGLIDSALMEVLEELGHALAVRETL